jgi:hypothetical protein
VNQAVEAVVVTSAEAVDVAKPQVVRKMVVAVVVLDSSMPAK